MEPDSIQVAGANSPVSVGGEQTSHNTTLQNDGKENPLYWQLGQKLGGCMLHIYTDNLWTDVIFRCKDHDIDDSKDRIHAHRIVLAARSPFFQGMFFGPCAEKDRGEYDLLTTDAEVFDLVLRYIYSDETRLTEKTASAVMELAHMYQIPTLVEYCATYLATICRAENACEIMNLALFYKQNKLRDAVCVFIDNHVKDVFDSDGFLQLSNDSLTYLLKGDTLFEDEEYIFKRVMNWAESRLLEKGHSVDGQSKREILGEAFHYLRVPSLDTLKFLRCTDGEDVYTVQEIVNIIKYINDKSFDYSCLCHSVDMRAPREALVLVPTDPLLNINMSFDKDETQQLKSTVIVQVSKDCVLRGISCKKMFPHLYYNCYNTIRKNAQKDCKADTLVDVTLDCTVIVDEAKYKSEFHVKHGQDQPVILEKPVTLKKKNTPYLLKFEMRYRSEHSLVFLEATSKLRFRERCSGDTHTEICLNMLQESPKVAGFSARYCDGSEHINCIESLTINFLPHRSNDEAESKVINV